MRILRPSHSAENEKEGTFWDFFTIHSVSKYQKIEGDPFEDIQIFVSKKIHTMPKKTEKREPLVSPGFVKNRSIRKKICKNCDTETLTNNFPII